jgi:hypothetical protein
MARMGKLKVFRTAIGFHDAYVAASSRKAALEAWGSDKDLFARGLAEQVTDEALTAEPLAHPGTVTKRLRGTADEQIAALPPDRPKTPRTAATPAKAGKRSSRPSRAPLDAAEAALDEAERRHEAALARIAARERKLAEEKRALRDHQQAERATLEEARDAAAAEYESAMDAWRG